MKSQKNFENLNDNDLLLENNPFNLNCKENVDLIDVRNENNCQIVSDGQQNDHE